jgi:hypothetical protein
MQDYRQAAAGIGRKVVGERFAASYSKQQQYGGSASAAYGAEGDSCSEEEGEDPLELQNRRSTVIGMVAYGVQADLVQGLSTRSIDVFRTLSHAWHAFLGLGTLSIERQG